ncbi:hypothetical protein D3C81_1444390 [compost metagenome]
MGTMAQHVQGVLAGALGVRAVYGYLGLQLGEPALRRDRLLLVTTYELCVAPMAHGTPVVLLGDPAQFAAAG